MVRSLKHRFGTALASLVCLLGTVTTANATAYTLDLSGGSASFAAVNINAKFTDDYRFILTSLADVFSATVIGSGLTNLSMNLFLETTKVKKNGTEKIIDTLIDSGTNMSFSDLAAGNYLLEIKGQGKRNALGSYSGTVSALAAPVPEPEVWAMMLVGVGLVGYQMRRKSKAGPVRIEA